MLIEVYKASKNDKKPTIATSSLKPFVNLDAYQKGTYVEVSLKINGKVEVIPMKLSRPKADSDGYKHKCSTLYGTKIWDSSFPHIDIGSKTLLKIVSIKGPGISPRIIW